MQKLKCLLVDDEPPARVVLRNLVSKIPSLEIAGECGNAFEAFQALQLQKIDVLFIDIQMPQLNGVDFIRNLSNPPRVVFTTAYPEFAVEGFELEALDYLLKPISYERFFKCIQKVLREFSIQTPLRESTPSEEETSYIFVRSERKMVKINVNEIEYVESLKDYVHFQLHNKGEIISKQTLQAIEEILPEEHFIRIHRSFLVNLNKVKAFDSFEIELSYTSLPIGRHYKRAVMDSLQMVK